MPERNKVIYNGTTLIDLTNDSVTPDTLAYGATAHSASGDIITGAAYKNTYYVKGTQNSSTGLWTGNLPEVSALYEGLSIDYWLPYPGSGNATLNLTLKDGTTTGPIDCYYSGTLRLNTHIPASNIMRLIYQTVTISGASYTGWWLLKAYDTNDAAFAIRNANAPYEANSSVHRYQLLFQVDEDKLTPLNNENNNTGTNKQMLTTVEFLPFGKMYAHCAQTSIAAGGNLISSIYSRNAIDLRYTFNCGQTLTSNADVYLKCIRQSNGKFRISIDPCWTQTLPVTNDGYYYLRLGRTYSTYQMYFDEFHPIYFHDGSSLQTYTEKNDSGLVSIQNPSIFSGAINFRKINNVVQINAHRINLVSSVSYGNYVELGTIPVGFRPQSGFYPASISGSSNQVGNGFNLLAYNIGSGYSQPFVVEINPSGTIVLYATVSTVHTTDNINISAMYFTD